MTPPLVTTPAYAAVLALFFVFLSVRTIMLRGKHRIALETGSSEDLLRATRAHANCAEYLPIGLILFAFWELRFAPAPLLHATCMIFLAGRVLHALGISRQPEPRLLRALGMVGTFTAINIAIAGLILSYL
ncbi:MAG: MAPEG family protein [Myxococcota bacterium]